MRKVLLLILLFTIIIKLPSLFAQTTAATPTYPRAVAYLSLILPIIKLNRSQTTYDFTTATTIGFPVGVNILYSDSFGFSYEVTPFVVAQKGISKVSNLVFDPGPMFRFKHGLTLITRLAFETQGRYGFTPVLNKVYLRTKAVNYFIAASLPTRFGNNQLPSIGGSLQFGFIFN